MGRGWKLGNALGGELCLRRVGAGAILSLECLLAWFLLNSSYRYPRHPQTEISSSTARLDLITPDSLPSQNILDPASRPLYPYSVIPGGVVSGAELKLAIANDPVIASHYREFNPANARVIQVKTRRAVYVSYRLDNHVFWTRRKVQLVENETLITDGEIAARTRCGNQVSEVPLAPVSLSEPPIEALEKPADPPLLADISPADEMSLVPPPASDIHLITHHGWIFIPPIVPAIPGGPGSSPGIPVSGPPPGAPQPPPSGPTQPPSGPTQPPSGPTQPPSGPTQPPISGPTQPPTGPPEQPPSGPPPPPIFPPPPSPPTTSVPEPDTLLLLSMGLSAVCMLRRKRKR
jgi:hypothetical protein